MVLMEVRRTKFLEHWDVFSKGKESMLLLTPLAYHTPLGISSLSKVTLVITKSSHFPFTKCPFPTVHEELYGLMGTLVSCQGYPSCIIIVVIVK